MTASTAKSPFEWLQDINDILHDEPYSIIAHGLFWTLLLFAVPFAGMGVMILTVFRVVFYLTGFSRKTISSRANKAVVITGCDSGFGYDVALQCHAMGYQVFAGCLRKDSVSALDLDGKEGLTPVLLDVCKEDDVEKLAACVTKWIVRGKEDRYLHAVVNNAGIGGNGGLVDWNNLDVYKKTMDVNFFGQVRMMQAFLPFLKEQQRIYHDARIVNMVSVAGLVPNSGFSPYSASKFAAESFSQCLRLELRGYKLKVVTMNPTFHESPLTANMGQHLRESWGRTPSQIKQKYGDEYFEKTFMMQAGLLKHITWRSSNVERDMLKAIDLLRPPTRFLTGMDAKFFFVVARMLPDWIIDFLFVHHFQTPAFLKEKKSPPTSDKKKQK
mmetsp:Transcript_1040/g.1607  ORF Transcript_1040/g.1607 Transcript_1040/m.1607 type:complete len:384 (-) Transcript_1040:272-1423(-)